MISKIIDERSIHSLPAKVRDVPNDTDGGQPLEPRILDFHIKENPAHNTLIKGTYSNIIMGNF